MTFDINLDMLETEDVSSLVEKIMNAKKKKEYLEAHKYKVYQGKDGRWFTRFPKKDGGSVQKAFRSKEDLESYIFKFYEAFADVPTLEDLFYEVTKKKEEEGSITGSTAARNAYDFKRFFDEFGSRRVDSITGLDVENFLRKQKVKHDLDTKGYAKLLGVTRSIFRYAKRKGLIFFRVDDVIDEMDWGKNAFRKEAIDQSDEVFDDYEVERLSSYLKANQNGKHLGLLLCFATGLRAGELAALKWEDVTDSGIYILRTERSWSDEFHKHHCEVVNLPKTVAGERIVPIPEQARWIIERLREFNPDGEWVFMVNGARTRTVYFRKAFAKACDAAGVKRKSIHKIRKTYASILLDNNVGTKAVIENMGHADIAVTNEKYARRRKSLNERAKVVSSIKEFDAVAAVAVKN